MTSWLMITTLNWKKKVVLNNIYIIVDDFGVKFKDFDVFLDNIAVIWQFDVMVNDSDIQTERFAGYLTSWLIIVTSNWRIFWIFDVMLDSIYVIEDITFDLDVKLKEFDVISDNIFIVVENIDVNLRVWRHVNWR